MQEQKDSNNKSVAKTTSDRKSKSRKQKSRSLRSKPRSVKSLLGSSSVEWDIRFGIWKIFVGQLNTSLPLYAQILSPEDTVILLKQFKLCNTDVEGNRYLIKDVRGENLFYGIEDNHCSDRLCICASSRAFTLTFFDAGKRPALRMERPCRLNCCGIIPFCKQKIQVNDSENKSIGKVTEKFNLCQLSLKVISKDESKELRVYGPACDPKVRSYCFDDICFEIKNKSVPDSPKSAEQSHIFKISELISGGHVYEIRFGGMSAELKALVIGAAILIDYYYFDNSFHEHKYHRMSNRASQSLPSFPLVPKDYDYSNEKSNETKKQTKK